MKCGLSPANPAKRGLCFWVRLAVPNFTTGGFAYGSASSSLTKLRLQLEVPATGAEKAFSSVPQVSGQLGRFSLIELHLGMWPRSRFVAYKVRLSSDFSLKGYRQAKLT